MCCSLVTDWRHLHFLRCWPWPGSVAMFYMVVKLWTWCIVQNNMMLLAVSVHLICMFSHWWNVVTNLCKSKMAHLSQYMTLVDKRWSVNGCVYNVLIVKLLLKLQARIFFYCGDGDVVLWSWWWYTCTERVCSIYSGRGVVYIAWCPCTGVSLDRWHEDGGEVTDVHI